MKKTLLTLALSVASLAAFGQGKIIFSADTLHMVYFSTDTAKLKAADAADAGKAYYASQTPIADGTTLKIEIWSTLAGSGSALSVVSTTSFTGATQPGNWKGPSYTFAAVDKLNPVDIKIKIYDNKYSSLELASAAGAYFGSSSLFTATLQASPAAMTTKNPLTVNSTWANGTYSSSALDASAGTSGGLGAIELQVAVPEPASFALAGLGAAAMLIFRRRK
jgi:hypothetical protein